MIEKQFQNKYYDHKNCTCVLLFVVRYWSVSKKKWDCQFQLSLFRCSSRTEKFAHCNASRPASQPASQPSTNTPTRSHTIHNQLIWVWVRHMIFHPIAFVYVCVERARVGVRIVFIFIIISTSPNMRDRNKHDGHSCARRTVLPISSATFICTILASSVVFFCCETPVGIYSFTWWFINSPFDRIRNARIRIVNV